MGRLFGTDGVRGIANSKELDAQMAYNLGRAGSFVLSKENNHKSVILVGKDTRASGDMLEAALIAGICSTGAKAVRLGVIPTPAVAYLARKLNADAGVVISALSAFSRPSLRRLHLSSRFRRTFRAFTKRLTSTKRCCFWCFTFWYMPGSCSFSPTGERRWFLPSSLSECYLWPA